MFIYLINVCASFTVMNLKTIGIIQSVFHHKNGTPRQSGVCPEAVAKLTISKEIFNNPEHSLEGLEEYSHVWYVAWPNLGSHIQN